MFELNGRSLDWITDILGSPAVRFEVLRPQTEVDLNNASIQLVDGRCFLMEDGILGYRAWQTPRYVTENEFLFEASPKKGQRYLWRGSKEPIELFNMVGLE